MAAEAETQPKVEEEKVETRDVLMTSYRKPIVGYQHPRGMISYRGQTNEQAQEHAVQEKADGEEEGVKGHL